MASNRVIGKDGKLPWDYPEDLQYFREMTRGKVVIMWRKTYLAIWRPLPNRRNIVLTSHPIEWLECYPSIPDMMQKLEADWVEEVWNIWWANIYAQFLDIAHYIYMTEIKKAHEGDTYFPAFEDKYEEIGRRPNATGEMDFVIYKKK